MRPEILLALLNHQPVNTAVHRAEHLEGMEPS